jgi:putative transposase
MIAKEAVAKHGVTIRWACASLDFSEACYLYQAKLSDENAEIVGWMIRLTHGNEAGAAGYAFGIGVMFRAMVGTISVFTEYTANLS